MSRPTSTRRRQGRRLVAVLVAAVLAILVSSCAKPTPSRTELDDALRRTGMAPAEATCVTDALLHSLTDEQVAAIVDRGSSGAPIDEPGTQNGPLARVRAALNACREFAAPTSTTTTAPGDTTSTTFPTTEFFDTTAPAGDAGSTTVANDGAGGTTVPDGSTPDGSVTSTTQHDDVTGADGPATAAP